ncbi:unnamed protein product, partial [Brenthis ino]
MASPKSQLASSVLPSTSTHPTSADIDNQPCDSLTKRVNPYVEEIRLQWNMNKVIQRLDTREQCLQFAEDRQLIPREKQCSYHRRPMSLIIQNGLVGTFRCRKSNCRTKSISRATGTWFENVHISLTLLFKLMYMFSRNYSYDLAQIEGATDDRASVLSTKTIADWYSYCREAIVIYELEHNEERTKIGGPNKVVQIDESKFGKRKYNRDRHIEGHWVLGMIEDGSDDLRLEICPDNEQSADILVPLVKKHVQEGSIIHTNSWKAYECLPEHGYIHKKSNHSDHDKKFVAPNTTHTQWIESHWRGLKKVFHMNQFKGNFTEWLVEFAWRRKIKINHLDPFEELLKVINYVYKLEK